MTPKQFKEARINLGYTQAQLADLWGLAKTSRRSVIRWENGECPINPIAIFTIKLMLFLHKKNIKYPPDNTLHM